MARSARGEWKRQRPSVGVSDNVCAVEPVVAVAGVEVECESVAVNALDLAKHAKLMRQMLGAKNTSL